MSGKATTTKEIMTEHTCSQGNEFTKIQKKIDEVKKDLDEHRHAEQKKEAEHQVRLKERKKRDDDISAQLNDITSQLSSLIELNKEYTDFKTAFRVGKNLGIGFALFIATVGAIYGGIFAFKEWLKH